jgi:hypothetical protein
MFASINRARAARPGISQQNFDSITKGSDINSLLSKARTKLTDIEDGR